MSYHYSSRYYAAPKPVIRDPRYNTGYHSRNSSLDSHGSYHSRTSTEYSGRCSAGYGGSAEQRAYDEYQKHKYRVPDNGNPSHPSPVSHHHTNSVSSTDRHAITTTREGKVDTVNHKQGRYDPNEPRASEATSTHYKSSQSRSSKSSKSGKHR